MTAVSLLIAAASLEISYDTWKRTFYPVPKTEPHQQDLRRRADDHKSSASQGGAGAPQATEIPRAKRGYDAQFERAPSECYRVATEGLGYIHLPLHNQPSAYSKILEAIPPDATGLRATGKISYSSEGFLWREVVYKRKVGWVDDFYIERM
jgi:hypothetical protein